MKDFSTIKFFLKKALTYFEISIFLKRTLIPK